MADVQLECATAVRPVPADLRLTIRCQQQCRQPDETIIISAHRHFAAAHVRQVQRVFRDGQVHVLQCEPMQVEGQSRAGAAIVRRSGESCRIDLAAYTAKVGTDREPAGQQAQQAVLDASRSAREREAGSAQLHVTDGDATPGVPGQPAGTHHITLLSREPFSVRPEPAEYERGPRQQRYQRQCACCQQYGKCGPQFHLIGRVPPQAGAGCPLHPTSEVNTGFDEINGSCTAALLALTPWPPKHASPPSSPVMSRESACASTFSAVPLIWG